VPQNGPAEIKHGQQQPQQRTKTEQKNKNQPKSASFSAACEVVPFYKTFRVRFSSSCEVVPSLQSLMGFQSGAADVALFQSEDRLRDSDWQANCAIVRVIVCFLR
jgi:hypothetical protein